MREQWACREAMCYGIKGQSYKVDTSRGTGNGAVFRHPLPVRSTTGLSRCHAYTHPHAHRQCLGNCNGVRNPDGFTFGNGDRVTERDGQPVGKRITHSHANLLTQALNDVFQQHCRRQCNSPGRGELPQHLL
jgi:hypothetical protein